MDFTIAALSDALRKIKEEMQLIPQLRLIISNTYLHHDILEIIFHVRGTLDIPFEISYALPRDAWMLVEDEGSVMFYSPGA